MITIRWAPPRQGKTYTATDEIVKNLQQGFRQQFTNWPVLTKSKSGKILSSSIWTPDLAYQNVQHSDIYIDEAYLDYNSRDYKNFSKDVHTFFTTCGHNDNDIELLAQNPARIDVVIRESCNGFLFVRKLAVPDLLWSVYANIMNTVFRKNLNPRQPRPLLFNIYNYLTEADMAARDPERAWSVQRVWYSDKTAQAYDTHYWRRGDDEAYQGMTWADKLGITKNEDSGLFTDVKS